MGGLTGGGAGEAVEALAGKIYVLVAEGKGVGALYPGEMLQDGLLHSKLEFGRGRQH